MASALWWPRARTTMFHTPVERKAGKAGNAVLKGTGGSWRRDHGGMEGILQAECHRSYPDEQVNVNRLSGST